MKKLFPTMGLLLAIGAACPDAMAQTSEKLAGWHFDDLEAASSTTSTPTTIAAESGPQATTAMLYANGSNGSSTWTSLAANPQLTSFGGTTVNDDRATTFGGDAVALANSSSNGQSIVFTVSTTDFEDLVLTYATRGTSTGFNSQLWQYSTDGTSFTTLTTFTGALSSAWVTRTVDFSAISALDDQATVYVRLTVDGASGTAGNNRLDNILFYATSTATSTPLSVAITSSTNVNCYGQATGSATAEAAGGTAPYSYTWSPSGGSAATATGLTAGIYTVTVTDANSATVTETVSISQPATAVSASIATQTNPVCNGQANGSAFVLPFGGTPAYTYSWNTSPAQTTAVATGLSAGTYTVTVTDNNGCEAIAVATLTDPAAVVATASSNSPVTSGSTIMLAATGGATYSWTGPDNFISLLQNPEITNATAANDGTYSVTVTNASGCTAMATTTVTVNAPATGNFTINQTAAATATNFISLASAADYFNTTGVTMPTVVTVVTGTGPYAGQLLLNEIPGSSATNTLTINGNGNEVNHCSTDPMNRDIIRLNGTDNIIIDGFVLNATCSQGWGVHVMGDVENVTISDNTINLSAPYSIYAGNMNGIIAGNSFTDPAAMGGMMSNLTISGNEINNGYHAIRINGNATNNATNVDIVENELNDATVFGIILSYGQDIAINGNDVFMFDAAAGKVISSKGIYIVSVENGISVQRNRVTNAGHMGLWLNYVNRASTTRGTVANNMIGGGFRNNNAIAVQLNSASHLDFYYNSINTDFGTTGVGLYVSNRHSEDLNVVNNSFAYTGGAGGRALQAGDAFYNFSTIDYNNYFSNGNYFVYFNRGFRANLAALQASTDHGVGIHDMNSIEANPMYQSPTDLNILMSSPLVGEGTPLASVTTDIYGTSRDPQAPAIGAHEPMVGPLRQAAFSNQVEVYPNPFANEFRVRATNLKGSVQIVLTDMMGRQVYNRALSASPELTIQPEVNLPQGIYLLEVTNNGTTTQHRVVKQ